MVHPDTILIQDNANSDTGVCEGGGGHGSCVGAAFDGDGAPGLTPASSVTPDAADQK